MRKGNKEGKKKKRETGRMKQEREGENEMRKDEWKEKKG